MATGLLFRRYFNLQKPDADNRAIMKPRTDRLVLILLALFTSCSGSSTWVFDKPPSTLVVTQRLVIEKKTPILFVVHDKEGDWQFLSSEPSRIDQVFELPFEELVAIDSTVVQVARLERGWKAWRPDRQSPWNFAVYK